MFILHAYIPMSSRIPYCGKANVYEEVKLFHQSNKTEGLHIFSLVFTSLNAINVNWNVNAMKCQNP